MTKIPKEIKVGTRSIEVEFREMSFQEDNGFYDSYGKTIIINSVSAKTEQIQAFWRELVKAILDYIRFTYQVEAERDSAGDPMKESALIEDKIANDFAPLLKEVIEKNKLV